MTARPRSRVEMIVERVEGPTVLDLGAVQHDAAAAASEDWLHGRLCERSERVIGVDIHPDARTLADNGYEMIQADATELDLAVTADTVVAGELIEHVDNPGLLLDRVHAHLRPGGRFVLSTPNPWGLPVLRRLLAGRLSVNDEHVAWYGPTVLRQLLARHGFEVAEIASTRRRHRGLTRLAQLVDSGVFGGTTWVCTATKPNHNHDTH